MKTMESMTKKRGGVGFARRTRKTVDCRLCRELRRRRRPAAWAFLKASDDIVGNHKKDFRVD